MVEVDSSFKGVKVGTISGVDERVGAKTSAVNIKGTAKVCDKKLGVAVSGEGDVLTADAYGAVIVRPDEATFGFRAGAEASVVSGGASVSFNVLGLNIEIGAEGSALSAGAKAEFIVEDVQIKARAKAALGLGGGVNDRFTLQIIEL